MGNLTQLSAGESFDDQTGLPLGEGYLTLQSSAGNRIVFNTPAEMNIYRLGNPNQFAGTPDSSGSVNDEIQGDN